MTAAVRRYSAFLGLLAQDSPLVPPLDVAWMWHAHKLNPLAYAADCEARFGALLDVPEGASAFAFCTLEKEDAASRALWEKSFPGVPFHLDASAPGAGLELLPASSTFSSSIVECASRQKDFLWQVSSPLYAHPAFLADGLRRYTQLLQLMALHPGSFITPCYDQDLMWHAHLGYPGAYARDTTAAIGCVAVHDDTVNDRSEGSKLSLGVQETAALWAATFPGETWAKRGAMYAGPPPPFVHAAEPRWRGGMPVAESYVPQPMMQQGVTMVPVTTGCCCCEETRMVPVANRANPAFVQMQQQPVMMMQQPGMMVVQQPVMMGGYGGGMYGGGYGYGGGMGMAGGLGTGLAIGAGAVIGAELAMDLTGGGMMGGGCGGGGGMFGGGGGCGGGGCGGGGGGW